MNIRTELLTYKNIEIAIRREDLLHPFISGNKFRKLKYSIADAQEGQHTTLLTFGGAYSNHIAATAFAGKLYNFKTIGVIRGEELKLKITQNPTLLLAQQKGMKLHFVTREEYQQKEESSFIEKLRQQFGDFYLIPEGGTSPLAIKGCQEILQPTDLNYTHICCPVGTGGTIAGIINSLAPKQTALGFSALKGSFLQNEIAKFATKTNYQLLTDYTFGGYAKTTPELIRFINNFYLETKIPLDPIYTGKMFFGIFDLIDNGFFEPKTKILALHTGGLQGIEGMNILLKDKGLETIKT